MNQTLMQLGMKPITSYTHILTTILNMVYLKMLSTAIIWTAKLKMILSVIKTVILMSCTEVFQGIRFFFIYM